MRNTIPFLLIISFTSFLLLNSCRKDHKSDTNSTPLSLGKFVATIDEKTWAPPLGNNVGYFPKWHELYFQAADNSYYIYGGVNLDSNNLFRQYLLESNGDNEAYLNEKGVTTYYSSQDMTDAGGSFELTKLDTIQKIVSGKFHFIGYSSDKSKRKEVSFGEITDIPYTLALTPYNGNSATCTVVGAKTTEWHSKEITTRIMCGVDDLKKSLEIRIGSILYFTTDRYIDFRIPLEKGTGSYQVYPQLSPYNDCGNRIITSYYNMENYYYYPTSGSLNITYLDTAQRKLKAEFNVAYRDTVRNNIIQISNGQINLNTWTTNDF
jgi:hypothetical protein